MERRIFNIVAKVMEVPIECIDIHSSTDNVESWDSLKHMNLVFGLEEEFGVQFEIEEIMEIMNVGHILRTLNEKLA